MVRSTLESLLSHAATRIDRGVLQNLERRFRGATPRTPEDARQRLLDLVERYREGRDPARFFPDPGLPEVRETPAGTGPHGARVVELAYESAYRPYLAEYLDEHQGYRENLTVHAKYFTLGEGRPVLVCIHGLGGGNYWLEERAFAAEYWLRQGFDVALIQLPFHGRRLPAGRARGSMFPSANVIRTNEAFGQAVSDLRALRAWFERRGSVVGVMGMSLGGYTTALWTTVDDRLAFAVPWIPAVDMADLMWRHGEDSPARRRAARAGVDAELLREVFAVHMPTGRPTRLPRERRMIVAGKGDLITPPDQAERLWKHWDECAIHWFPGGHLAQVGRADALRAVRRHLDTLALPGRAARS
jgi:pimeloyl-ACP methyl ester carboxylesterase